MSTGGLLASFAAALGLALIHLVAGGRWARDHQPRSRWLSAAGGASVAYVFLHLLPQLARLEEAVIESGIPLPAPSDRPLNLVALAGLATFYGLDRLAHRSRADTTEGGRESTSDPVFWTHTFAFAAYNVIVGYLLVDIDHEHGGLAIFALAMALHFLGNDFALWEHHKANHSARGRWILAPAVLAGWALGALYDVPVAGVGILLAFLAGGIVLNVLKDEVPGQGQSCFRSFVLGMGGYTVVLLLGGA